MNILAVVKKGTWEDCYIFYDVSEAVDSDVYTEFIIY